MLYIFENENHINSVLLKTVVNKNASASVPVLADFFDLWKKRTIIIKV